MGLMDLLSHFAAQLTFTDFHAEATTSSKSWHGQSESAPPKILIVAKRCVTHSSTTLRPKATCCGDSKN
jgi:hypothetical protein